MEKYAPCRSQKKGGNEVVLVRSWTYPWNKEGFGTADSKVNL